MTWAGPEFVLAIIAISTCGWLVSTWIRARHGYALENEWGGKTARPEQDAVAELRQENEALRAQLAGTLDRLANVEAIVTDRGFEVSHRIDALRQAKPLPERRNA